MTQPPSDPSQKPRQPWLWVLSILAVVGALAILVLAFRPDVVNQLKAPRDTASSTDTNSDNRSNADIEIVVTDGQWLTEPKLVSPTPTLFDDYTEFYGLSDGQKLPPDFSLSVYELGTLSDGQRVLVAVLPANGPGGDVLIVLTETGGAYTLLTQHSPWVVAYNDPSDYTGPHPVATVKVDTKTKYDELSFDEQITYNGTTLELSGPSMGILTSSLSDVGRSWILPSNPTDGFAYTKLGEAGGGTLYSLNYDTDPNDGLALNKYVLRLPNHLATVYQYHPSIFTDDWSMNAEWNDGSTTAATYRVDGASGCGSPDSVAIVDGYPLEEFTAIGKVAGTNEALYAPNNADHPLYTYYYDLTGGKRYESVNGEYTEITFTKEEYVQNHGLVVYKDPLGRLLLFINSDFGPLAECGKPVIYLYPTEAQTVSVKVGADITVSEPTYPADGWTAYAEPNGHLTVDNQPYDYLFWEGLGHGEYPEIREGFVVPQAELATTLRDHLTKLGLNAKESADFLEFWEPRMPQTPYVRLTWFGTKQMDALAPLDVTPKPDTSIRIFLDFEGLREARTLAPQRLTAPTRRGFTLVEWGGLLHQNQK